MPIGAQHAGGQRDLCAGQVPAVDPAGAAVQRLSLIHIFTMADLAEPEVLDPEALRLIVNATLIARYGLAAFKIRARGAEYER